MTVILGPRIGGARREIYPEAEFLGACKGVVLTRRGDEDPHVCFTVVTEDDGNWFVSQSHTSSFWYPDLMRQIQAAQAWMEANCVKNPDGFGYDFREPA